MEDFIPYKKWTSQHAEKIKAEFSDRQTKAMAQEMDMNYFSVSRRATSLGLSKSAGFMHASWKNGAKKKGGWKKQDDRHLRLREAAWQYMREHFADTKNEDLAGLFGVDVKTVRRWARRLGLVKSEAFMQEARSKRKRYYTDEQQAWRRQRIAEVFPDGDEAALQALADELGVTTRGLKALASKFRIHRSPERVREVRSANSTKYGPEVIAALREYYPDHTTAECAEHFGIPSPIISQLAIRYGIRKSPAHLRKVRAMPRKKKE